MIYNTLHIGLYAEVSNWMVDSHYIVLEEKLDCNRRGKTAG